MKQKNQPVMSQGPSRNDRKPAYEAPTCRELGSVARLTEAKKPGAGDMQFSQF